uniref:Antithrombin-III n=1 Tax=Steinernema glaseri TaxID=37863 RepID=A0A1I8A645_9BILA
ELFEPTPTSLEVLAKSVTRGTLRLFASYDRLKITNELFHVLLQLVASVQIEEFSLYLEINGSLSFETILSGLVDAFLSRERAQRFRFVVNKSSEQLSEQLVREVEKQGKVEIKCNAVLSMPDYICVCRIKEGQRALEPDLLRRHANKHPKTNRFLFLFWSGHGPGPLGYESQGRLDRRRRDGHNKNSEIRSGDEGGDVTTSHPSRGQRALEPDLLRRDANKHPKTNRARLAKER